MKIMRVFLSGIFVFCTTAYGNKDYELFLEANQTCKQGRYKDAIDLYKKMQIQSASVFYNTGYAWYGLGNYKEALIVWRQAERTAAGTLFKKVRKAITVALSKTNQEQDGWLYSTLVYLQAGIWVGSLQILTMLLLVLLLFFIYQTSTKSRYNKLILIFLHCTLVLVLTPIGAYYYIQGNSMARWAVVKEDQLSVFALPHSKAHSIGTVLGGTLVKLVDENGAWCKMHYPRAKGWVQQDGIFPLKPV